MYWTAHLELADYDFNFKIEVASMDGQNRTILHDTNLTNIHALTIDYQRQVLYWTNGNMIECSNVDGSNRRVLIVDGISSFVSLSLFDHTLYSIDQSGGQLKAIDINSGNATEIFKGFICFALVDIAVVSNQNQPTGEPEVE